MAAALYTPELLALAVELAAFPPAPDLAFHGEARSSTCGSTLAIDLSRDRKGQIDAVGVRAQACAVGQAAAAIFAKGVIGRSDRSIAAAASELDRWLAGDGDLPDWPGLWAIAMARDYPARHGAVRLPWMAARAALSSAPVGR